MTEDTLFLADRMLGTLARYLRFMGYDTKSANSLVPGNSREDTVLLGIAKDEGRYLLTRDRELARRGSDGYAVFIRSDDIICQIKQLFEAGLIDSSVTVGMRRCVICNSPLRRADADEISLASYAPEDKKEREFMWCPVCRKLYWTGTHSENLKKRLKNCF